MRSTTGKIIKFTLQRTPTWAWAGLVSEPIELLYMPSDEFILPLVAEFKVFDEIMRKCLVIPSEFINRGSYNLRRFW